MKVAGYSRSDPARAGVSLAELLVALLLGLFIVHFALDSLSRLGAARSRIAVRTDALVALRVARHVLRRELRNGVAGADWALGDDSLSIRAFRGVALVCRVDSASVGLLAPYTGDRAPDPTKDSVLLLTADGSMEVRGLGGTAASGAPCRGVDGAAVELWRLDGGPPEGVVVAKLFERGSYHLSGSALRYRRGPSGRQPLTPEVWSSETRWTFSPGRLGLELIPRDTAAGPPWRGFLARVGDP